MINNIIRYFDLQSNSRTTMAKGQAGGVGHAPVFPQYITLAAGVVLEPFLRRYIDSGAWNFDGSVLIGRIVFGSIIGIIILPAVYKSSFDPQKPVLVQLAALFPLGIGWQSLFTTATKIVTS
jgi:hypothetical protein